MNVITPKFPQMLHGGDYDPEQWLGYPDVLENDITLMKQAHINCVSLGIFAWSRLEPEEGCFDFGWLDDIIDRLWKAGIYVDLATPSGARPHWLADKYPEVLRVWEDGSRAMFGGRHNHCFTSLVYREKVRIIDTELAERYSSHPAVIMWHISNEFSGDCRCPMCREAFREFLKKKYGSLDRLNHEWWAHFWSHTYTSWEQIEPPSYKGETAVHGLDLDWKRFVTHQTVDFMKAEIAAVKSAAPEIPVTANFMGMYFDGLDYFELGEALDVISWDSYPEWHAPCGNEVIAMNESLSHDMMRSIKGKPFLLMECTPSTTNWRGISKLKKPGMHRLAILNAIAHGSDSAMYFQIRQSRGSAEKFHSAVISHTGTSDTRTFREVTEVGEMLEKLTGRIYGSSTPAEAAIIYEPQSKWALDKAQGPRNAGLNYFDAIQRCYHYFWANGINVDIVNENSDISRYKLVVLPMLYLWRDGFSDRLREFVKNGGTLISTVFSGIVGENDLCFLGEATEEKLSDVMGYWVEETDSLYDGEANSTVYSGREFELTELCEVLRPTTCEVLAVYGSDFYKGKPAVTANRFGSGMAYHVAANAPMEFFDVFIGDVAPQLKRALDTGIPAGVNVTLRQGGDGTDYIFVQNFLDTEQTVALGGDYTDILSGRSCSGEVTLEGCGAAVLVKE
jgi:beta-galactosidase